MANVQQAAKWMKQGRYVQRRNVKHSKRTWALSLNFMCFTLEDLLADDWEVCDGEIREQADGS